MADAPAPTPALAAAVQRAAAVLAKHDPDLTSYDAGDLWGCRGCAWEADRDAPADEPGNAWDQHAQHQAEMLAADGLALIEPGAFLLPPESPDPAQDTGAPLTDAIWRTETVDGSGSHTRRDAEAIAARLRAGWLPAHDAAVAAPLVALLALFADADGRPCSFDHRGDCQAHGWFDLRGQACPVQRARDAVAAAASDTNGDPHA